MLESMTASSSDQDGRKIVVQTTEIETKMDLSVIQLSRVSTVEGWDMMTLIPSAKASEHFAEDTSL
jgi:hypothetical protein